MAPCYRRGFTRVFCVLTMAWVVTCTVIFPLGLQFEGQRQAEVQYEKDTKMCQALMAESPLWGPTKTCFDDISRNNKTRLVSSSFKNFWMVDLAFGRVLIFAIILPPIFLYLIALAGVWIWQGFRK